MALQQLRKEIPIDKVVYYLLNDEGQLTQAKELYKQQQRQKKGLEAS